MISPCKCLAGQGILTLPQDCPQPSPQLAGISVARGCNGSYRMAAITGRSFALLFKLRLGDVVRHNESEADEQGKKAQADEGSNVHLSFLMSAVMPTGKNQ